ncbi:high-affinity branched-chain amino acid transport protein (ABC superfamily, ATP-binding) [Modestobacter italicus]|uniref:High-affinity branched-chain amino acid transport protein (ABC superfamily, ATP-binding) n=1 Tax=Modestobacter italicus (strain DSM 44449 / CECT 9708 / BC 501) TaxID=2732864 RepID=I4ERI2_MODI5|nr:ABC transporter ATP-binding protein [Modestobacter marinus]CCH85995.1 high-affinity branched-chain amino acid transport protein (ABC superfamily, ATP-binding) [Modestobacter marinus]
MADTGGHGSTAVRTPGGTPGAALLQVEDLTSAYGAVRALDGVTLSAEAGRITAVLGANGAGKTTLLRTVSGLVRCVSGRVTLDGEDITSAPVESMVGRGMAHVPEGRGVIAELTVDENLRVGSLFRGKVARSEFDRIYDLFPRIAERRDQPAHVLSGGERQMLVIGRALLAQPRVLLLDEPSLGLAPRIVAQIFGLLRRLVDAEGLSVLLVEQNARSALSVADVGVVLNLGRVVVTDSARTLMADEDLRHAYLGF